MVSYGAWGETIDLETGVLILVVVEDGLVHRNGRLYIDEITSKSLL